MPKLVLGARAARFGRVRCPIIGEDTVGGITRFNPHEMGVSRGLRLVVGSGRIPNRTQRPICERWSTPPTVS
jgi:hypothetical protein